MNEVIEVLKALEKYWSVNGTEGEKMVVEEILANEKLTEKEKYLKIFGMYLDKTITE